MALLVLCCGDSLLRFQLSSRLCRTGKDYLRVLNVNVVGPFLVTVHFLPLLRKKQTRAVVHTSSICGSIAGARQGMFGGNIIAYNSSKVGMLTSSVQQWHNVK